MKGLVVQYMKIQRISFNLALVIIVFGAIATLEAGQGVEKYSPQKKKSQKEQRRRNIAIHEKTKKIEDEEKVNLPADAFLIDKIEAVVFAQEGAQVITKADTNKPSLDGRMRTLDELILESLMYLDAKRMKILPDEATIDKHLEAVQRDNNLTLSDLKNIFKASGYTFEEGREQFGMISVVNQLLDYKIRSRLIIPEKEVVAYFNAHPEKIERAYYIMRAVIPYSYSQNKAAQQQEIEEFISSGQGLVKIDWQEPFWRNDSELPDTKRFLTTMNAGETSKPVAMADGFELFQLKEIRPESMRTLDDRYREIVDILRKPKYEQLFTDYKTQLTNNASVLYMK